MTFLDWLPDRSGRHARLGCGVFSRHVIMVTVFDEWPAIEDGSSRYIKMIILHYDQLSDIISIINYHLLIMCYDDEITWNQHFLTFLADVPGTPPSNGSKLARQWTRNGRADAHPCTVLRPGHGASFIWSAYMLMHFKYHAWTLYLHIQYVCVCTYAHQ